MRIFFKWVLILLTLFWMGFIFYMSAADGTESGEMSHSVGETMGKVLHSDFEEWPREEQTAYVEKIQFPLRKLAHFFEYVLLGLLLSVTLQVWGVKSKPRFFTALGGGIIYAVTDEIHQMFVEGRGPGALDVLIDSGGVLLGASLVALILFAYKKRKRV